METPKSDYTTTQTGNKGTIATDDSSKVTFINKYEPKGGLAVHKTVTGTGAPADDRFTFTVKVGGVVYANQGYILCDSNGDEITEGKPYATDAETVLITVNRYTSRSAWAHLCRAMTH